MDGQALEILGVLVANTGIHQVSRLVTEHQLSFLGTSRTNILMKYRSWTNPHRDDAPSFFVVRAQGIPNDTSVKFEILVDTLLGPVDVGCAVGSEKALGSGKDLRLAIETSKQWEELLLGVVRLVPRSQAGAMQPVTLLLDIGNSRTTVSALETGYNDCHLARDLYPLELGRADQRPQEIVESWMELCHSDLPTSRVTRRTEPEWRPAADLLRRTARPFADPSLTRVGFEAFALSAGIVRSDEMQSWNIGLSSPKRYLWDQKPVRSNWHAHSLSGSESQPQLLHGELLRYLDWPLGSALAMAPPQPNFSRSHMMVLFVFELLYQAFHMLNRKELVEKRMDRNCRFIDNILFAHPSNMPLLELQIFTERVESATEALYDLVLQAYEFPRPAVLPPYLDEGTASELAFVYSKLSQGSDGWRLWAKAVSSKKVAGEYVSVGCIDIGGGSIDASLIRYGMRPSVADRQIEAILAFTDGVSCGGDDILRDLIETMILPETARQLGVPVGQLQNIVKDGTFSSSRRKKPGFGRKMLLGLLYPAAIRYVQVLEGTARATSVDFGDLPGVSLSLLQEIQATLESHLPLVKGLLADVLISIDLDSVPRLIERTIGGALEELAKRLTDQGAVVIVLSGRLSALPPVPKIVGIASRLPERAVIQLCTEESLRPFSSSVPPREDWVIDPKQAVLIGAGVAEAIRQGLTIDGYSIEFKRPHPDNRCAYWGRLNANTRTILKGDLLFPRSHTGGRTDGAEEPPALSDVAKNTTAEPDETTISATGRFLLGRRFTSNAEAEAKPVYEVKVNSGGGPVEVRVKRHVIEYEGADNLVDEGLEIRSTSERVSVELRTLFDDEYWLDGGLRRR